MPRKIQIALRIAGVAVIAFAAIHLIIDVARSMQTEKHATPDGFIIDRQIEVPHATLALGIAGAVLFGLSFIRVRKST